MKKYEEIGLRIIELRGKISQKDFANKIGTSIRAYQNYESGDRLPPGKVLAKIADISQVTTDWILTGKIVSLYNLLIDKKAEVLISERELDKVHKDLSTVLREKGLPIPKNKLNSFIDIALFLKSKGFDLTSILQKNQPMEVKESDIEYGSDFVFIPQVAGEISAGGGLVADNIVELKIAFRKEWIQRRGDPKNMSLIRVSGDSMEPTLQSGDLALVDHGKNYIDPQGGIYAIAIDHTIMIKRIQVMHPSKHLKVISDNARYDPIETEQDRLRINGKVIWFGREIER